MKTFARTYWFTWGFLVLAAAFTGVASLKDAFFGGIFAAGLSAALTRVYERSGVGLAPLVGAAAGALWAMLMLWRIRWLGYPDEIASAQWTLGVDISVHAAGFAGAGLLTALLPRTSFAKAAFSGVSLAAAMTAVPFGFIAWIDHQLAGPVEVVLLVSPSLPSDEGPYRAPGALNVQLSPEEVELVRNRLLVVAGPGGNEVLDEQGRRYWPLWRRRLTYPGNPGGPVRRVFLLLPPDLVRTQSWTVPVSQAPRGAVLVLLDDQGRLAVTPSGLSQSVRMEVLLRVRKNGDDTRFEALDIEVSRRSPFADLYAPVGVRGLSAEFAAAPSPARKDADKPRLSRPVFPDAPAR